MNQALAFLRQHFVLIRAWTYKEHREVTVAHNCGLVFIKAISWFRTLSDSSTERHIFTEPRKRSAHTAFSNVP